MLRTKSDHEHLKIETSNCNIMIGLFYYFYTIYNYNFRQNITKSHCRVIWLINIFKIFLSDRVRQNFTVTNSK